MTTENAASQRMLEEIRSAAANLVAAGYADRRIIIKTVTEQIFCDDDYEPVDNLDEQVVAITDQLLQSHLAEERSWMDLTDCDRLDIAFTLLEQRGIVARQDFTCCKSCGRWEVEAEVQKTKAQGRPVRGFVFFHKADTGRVLAGGPLLLAFGSGGSSEDDAVIAAEIVELLRLWGLRAEWDGDPSNRIQIRRLDWRRRRFTRPPLAS